MTTVGQRMGKHNRVQNKVTSLFEELGIKYCKYGVERGMSQEFHNSLMSCGHNHSTSKLIRFMPDKVVTVNGKCSFCEIKTTLKENTPHFSYELKSHEVGKKLVEMGCNVFIIFDGEKACWFEDIEFHKKLENPKYLRDVKGSRTPFGLIRKDSDFFYRAKEFLVRWKNGEFKKNHARGGGR